MTTDHQLQIEQQITGAWQRYVNATLDHRPDEAKLAYAQVDRLLEKLPAPRDPAD